MMDQTERTRVLSDLVKINSVNGNELEVANYLRRLFEQHGLTADVQPLRRAAGQPDCRGGRR